MASPERFAKRQIPVAPRVPSIPGRPRPRRSFTFESALGIRCRDTQRQLSLRALRRVAYFAVAARLLKSTSDAAAR